MTDDFHDIKYGHQVEDDDDSLEKKKRLKLQHSNDTFVGTEHDSDANFVDLAKMHEIIGDHIGWALWAVNDFHVQRGGQMRGEMLHRVEWTDNAAPWTPYFAGFVESVPTDRGKQEFV